MQSTHWAIYALKDIQKSLDMVRYDVAGHHIDDAIHAIIARDAQNDHESDTESLMISTDP